MKKLTKTKKLTVRNVAPQLLNELHSKAVLNKRSLQQDLMALLEWYAYDRKVKA